MAQFGGPADGPAHGPNLPNAKPFGPVPAASHLLVHHGQPAESVPQESAAQLTEPALRTMAQQPAGDVGAEAPHIGGSGGRPAGRRGLLQELAGHDDTLDLVGALADLGDLGVMCFR